MGVLVTKIQSYSVHDGPGIRTTVFLKGCTLRCPWCANPETQDCANELWFDDKLCVGKENKCLFEPSCSIKKAATLPEGIRCPANALKEVACEYSNEELLEILIRDLPFWGKSGGVTFSGGEPLLHIAEYEPLLISLKSKNVSICFETALNIPEENVLIMLKYADIVYVDMKSVIRDSFEKLGGNPDWYLSNIRMLNDSKIPYIIRIPLIKPYTYNAENIEKITAILSELHPEHVEIFSGHDMGAKKYEMLGRKYEPCSNVFPEELSDAVIKLSRSGLQIKVLKLG